MERISLTQSQMNVMLVAVEHGYKQREKGASLEAALASVFDLYEVRRPTAPDNPHRMEVAY
jgi:hypothetical protein